MHKHTRLQEQVTKLIREVLFHAWRQYATNPLVRLNRKNRPAATSAWVQRMMAPKNKTARGAEDGDRGGGSGGRDDAPAPLESTLEKEVGVVGRQLRPYVVFVVVAVVVASHVSSLVQTIHGGPWSQKQGTLGATEESENKGTLHTHPATLCDGP